MEFGQTGSLKRSLEEELSRKANTIKRRLIKTIMLLEIKNQTYKVRYLMQNHKDQDKRSVLYQTLYQYFCFKYTYLEKCTSDAQRNQKQIHHKRISNRIYNFLVEL